MRMKRRKEQQKKLKTIPQQIKERMLRLFLFVMICSNIIVNIVSALWMYEYNYSQITTELRAISTSMEQLIMKYSYGMSGFNENAAMAQLLQSSNEEIPSKNKFSTRLFKEFQEYEAILDMYLINLEGTIIDSMVSDLSGKSVSDQSYFQRVIQSKDTVIDNMVYLDYLNRSALIISCPIKYSNEIIGVTALVIDTTFLDNVVKEFGSNSTLFYILDGNGMIAYSSEIKEVGREFDPETYAIMNSEEASKKDYISYKMNGKGYVLTYMSSEQFG